MGIHGLSFFINAYPTLLEKKKWKTNNGAETLPSTSPVDHFFIDGNAFVYSIAFENRTHWTHGGQYAAIADVVTKTVKQLQNSRIKPTFLFDGALPTDKIETRIKRHRSYIERCASTYYNLKQINTANKKSSAIDINQLSTNDAGGIQYHGDLFLIPPLTLDVVIQTLRELKGVEVKICRAEADGEVVLMAVEASKRGHTAYIVSQDSDMFVYPEVGSGYIPLDLLSIPIEFEDENEFISASVFQPEKLTQLLNLKHTYLLPLFGALMGNDYLDADLLKFPIVQWYNENELQQVTKNLSGWPKVIADFIRRITERHDRGEQEEEGNPGFCLVQDIVNELKPIISKSSMKSREALAEGFEERLFDSISRYDSKSPLLLHATQTPLHSDQSLMDYNEIISKHLSNYRTGVSRHLLDIIGSRTFWCSIFLEDVEKEFVWNLSRPLREGIYQTVSKQFFSNDKEFSINEYVRVKQHLEISEVYMTDNSVATLNDPLETFYQLHRTYIAHLRPFTSELHPLILCLRFMIYHYPRSTSPSTKLCDRLSDYEVVGIVIATLKSLAPILQGISTTSPTLSAIPSLKKRHVHLASQFQSILYSSYLFSQILDIPGYLQQPQVLACTYNGLYFHHYIEMAKGGASIAQLLGLNATPTTNSSIAASDDFASLFCSVYKTVLDGLENDIRATCEYNLSMTTEGNRQIWMIPTQKPKRLNPSPAHSKSHNNINISEPNKKKKKKTTNSYVHNNDRSANAFNVLSFGCSFDE